MVTKRKIFTGEFKAKVSLEAISQLKTITELSQEYKVHPNQITKWKRYTLEHIAEIFNGPRGTKRNEDIELIDQLYRQIGKLQVELEWLKKKFESIG